MKETFESKKKRILKELSDKKNVSISFIQIKYKVGFKLAAQIYQEIKNREEGKMERVELHLHTKMSKMDGISSISDYCKKAKEMGMRSIAVTDHASVQSFKDAQLAAGEYNIKIIYGCELYVRDDDREEKANDCHSPWHVIALAKNKKGLKDLFQIITLSYTKYIDKGLPIIPKSVLSKYRTNLLLGSACYNGDVFLNALSRKDEDLKESISFYDYIEVQPIDCYPQMISEAMDIKNKIAKIVKISDELNKVVVATGDVHYCCNSHKICRDILVRVAGQLHNRHPLFESALCGFENPNQHLRSTKEMLDCMSWLGVAKAYEITVTNTNMIADLIEPIAPVSNNHFYTPTIDNSEAKIKEICFSKAHELYGDVLPKIVEDRINDELNGIIKNEYSSLIMSFFEIVKKTHDNGYLVSTRSGAGSSLVLFLLGITNINPLPPHYYCEKCHHFELSKEYEDGYDLPYQKCPICGNDLIPDGHDIPYEMFLGINADKVPDIDLNVGSDYQHLVHEYVRDYFGKENVAKAGTLNTIMEKTAIRYTRTFFDLDDCYIDEESIKNISKSIEGIKTTTGQHPGGLLVLPKNHDWNEFTPLQYPSNDTESNWKITHLDFHDLRNTVYKMDILGHISLTRLMNLQRLTGVKVDDIDLNNPDLRKVLAMEFDDVNLFGIPEFSNKQSDAAIGILKPKSVKEIIQINGILHGTNTWLPNNDLEAKRSIMKISTREDLFLYLRNYGVPKDIAFKAEEEVRKGCGLNDDVRNKLIEKSIPEIILKACDSIKYLFPKAHAIEYVRIALTFAYYKLHYPLEFYKDYLEYCGLFSANFIKEQPFLCSLNELYKILNKCSLSMFSIVDIDFHQRETINIMIDMLQRGFSFEKVRINEGWEPKFDIDYKNKKLIPVI